MYTITLHLVASVPVVISHSIIATCVKRHKIGNVSAYMPQPAGAKWNTNKRIIENKLTLSNVQHMFSNQSTYYAHGGDNGRLGASSTLLAQRSNSSGVG